MIPSKPSVYTLLVAFLLLHAFCTSAVAATEPEIDVIFPDVTIEGEQFGRYLSADGSLLAVLPAALDSVYVFAKEGSSWTQEAKLDFPEGILRTSFYRGAIAISGDILVVGAPGDDPKSSVNTLGATFVYTRGDGTWPLVTKLAPPEPITEFVEGANFGASVAIDGPNLLVGAPGVDFDRTFGNVGAVYPYRFDGSNWTEQVRIDLPDFPGSNTGFGASIALDGSTAVVTGVRVTGFSRRVALVYEYDGASWTRTDVLQASDAADRWDLTGAVDVSGDRVILRGFRNPTGERALSAAYLFGKSSSGWEELQKLEADGTEVISASGTPQVDVLDVAILGTTCVVSGNIAVSNSVGGSVYDGGAFVFETDNGLAWNQTRFLRSTNVITVGPSSGFGWSVAIAESDILVGAIGDDIQVLDGGAVYVFDGPPPPVTDSFSITPMSLDFGEVFVGEGGTQKTVTIQNLSAESIVVNTSTTDSFGIISDEVFNLPIGSSAVIRVSFTPAALGLFNGTLTVAAGGQFEELPLSGEGVSPPAPIISVSPDPLDFGTIEVDSSKVVDLVITNSGADDLFVTSILLGGLEGPFEIQGESCTQGIFAPDTNCTISISFNPTETGDAVGALLISSNAANVPYEVVLRGTGVRPDKDLDGIPDSLDLCPNEPEDLDGFQDEEGCPEPGGGVKNTPPLSQEEQNFKASIDPVPLKPRPQRLRGNDEALIAKSAITVLSEKRLQAILDGSPQCLVSTWAAGIDAADKRFVGEAISSLTRSVFSGSISIGLEPFAFAGKIVVTEAAIVGLGLVSDSAFGVLDVSDISGEAAKALARVSLGYVAPLLTNSYVGDELEEWAIRATATGISDLLLKQLLEKERSTMFSATGENRRSAPFVTAKVGFAYNEDTHFVTLFVRSTGAGCSSNVIYVLRYEIDEDGLLLSSDEVEHIPVEIR